MARELLTCEATGYLGVPWWILHALIRSRNIDTPRRNASNHYVWSPENLRQAREALKEYRPRRPGRRPKPQPAAG